MRSAIPSASRRSVELVRVWILKYRHLGSELNERQIAPDFILLVVQKNLSYPRGVRSRQQHSIYTRQRDLRCLRCNAGSRHLIAL